MIGYRVSFRNPIEIETANEPWERGSLWDRIAQDTSRNKQFRDTNLWKTFNSSFWLSEKITSTYVVLKVLNCRSGTVY